MTTMLTRRDAIGPPLAQIVATLFGVSADQIDTRTTFLEMGADSLLLMRLTRALEQRFGVSIPFRVLMGELSTIEALARTLGDRAESREPMESPRSPASTGDSVGIHSGPQPDAPPPVPAEPAHAASGAVTRSTLETLAVEQLRVMSKQLDLLTRRRVEPPQAAGTSSVPEIAAPAASSTPSIDQSEQPAESFGPFKPVRAGIAGDMTPTQAAWLTAFIREYVSRTAGSRRQAEQYRAVLADPRASAGFKLAWKEMVYPIVERRARGSRLWDIDGNELIDLTMGFGVHLFGHAPEFLTRALADQLDDGLHIGPQSRRVGAVAAAIAEMTGFDRVAFCNSGTEAMMAAVRLARGATGRSKIVMFAGSYHGTFDGVLARSGTVGGQSMTVPVAKGTTNNAVADVLVLDYDAPESLDVIRRNADDIAAVLVEPVQSRRLDRQPGHFLRELRHLTSQRRVALIFDEIISGFRVHPRGAQGWFDVDADIAAYGKAISGGLPLGVVAGRAAYLDQIDGGSWSYGDASHPSVPQVVFAGTFSKNPMAIAAADALLTELRTRGPGLQRDLNTMTATVAARLSAVFEAFGVPFRVTHFGSMFRFERPPQERWLDLVFFDLLLRGIYIWEGRGCFLSAAHTAADCDALVHGIEQSLGELARGGFLPDRRPAAIREPGRSAERAGQAPNVICVPVTGPLRQIWIHTRVGRAAALAYNEVLAVRMRGALDVDALATALQRLSERHEALRASFDPTGDHVRIEPSVRWNLPCTAVESTFNEQGEMLLQSLISEVAGEPFDLTVAPLLRTGLFRLAPQDHLFVLVFHHAMVDGLSVAVLFADLAHLYQAARGGRAAPPPPMQLGAYLRQQRRQEESPAMADAKAFWLRYLSGAAPLAAPAPLPEMQTHGDHPPGRRHRLVLDQQTAYAAKAFAAREGCTFFTLALASFLIVLHRWSERADLTIGIPTLQRTFAGDDTAVADSVDLVPYRARLDDGAETVRSFLHRVDGEFAALSSHAVCSYGHLVQDLTSSRGRSGRVITTTFNLDPPRRAGAATPEFGGLQLTRVAYERFYVKFDLHWNLSEQDGTVNVSIEYDSGRWDPNAVAALATAYATVLHDAAVDPDRPIERLAMAPQVSEAAPVERSQRPTAGDPRLVSEAVADHARQSPQHAAIVEASRSVSYADLEDLVGPLVDQLLASGAQPECPVLVYARHGAAAAAAHLAVARAGACCVPVDANQSPVRIAAIADRSAARLVVADRAVPPVVGYGRHVIMMADRSGPTGRPSTARIVHVHGHNLAYVLYRTEADDDSDPVAVSHAELARLVNWRRNLTGTASRDHVSSAATHGHIEWLWEVWSALTAGATLEIVPAQCPTAEQHVAWLREQSMTVANVPAGMTAELLEWIDRSPASSIRAVVASDADLRRAAPRNGRIALINVRQIAPRALAMVATTIGTEVPATPAVISAAGASAPLLVLDEQLAPTPSGFSGSLFVTADPAARGVDARATAATYVPHPRPTKPGDRLIETGQRVRVRSSPYLELLDVQAPQGQGTPLRPPFCAPRTPLEEIVADAWRDVLSLSQIGIHDDFNDLGGDSLLAIRIVSRVVEAIDRDLSVAMLLDHPTVAAFCAEIERCSEDVSYEQLASMAAAGERGD